MTLLRPPSILPTRPPGVTPGERRLTYEQLLNLPGTQGSTAKIPASGISPGTFPPGNWIFPGGSIVSINQLRLSTENGSISDTSYIRFWGDTPTTVKGGYFGATGDYAPGSRGTVSLNGGTQPAPTGNDNCLLFNTAGGLAKMDRTGRWTLPTGLTVTTGSVDIAAALNVGGTLSGRIVVNGPLTTGYAGTEYQATGAQRWFIGRGVVDLSNDFQIFNYVGNKTPVSINSATSAITLAGLVTVSGGRLVVDGLATGAGAAGTEYRAAGAQRWFLGRGVLDNSDDFQLFNYVGNKTPIIVSSATNSVKLFGAFGCNNATPQTPAVSGGTLAGVIAALVANGILSS